MTDDLFGPVPTQPPKRPDPAASEQARALAQRRWGVKSKEQAKADADSGVKRASEHAEAVTPEWIARAEALVIQHAKDVYPKDFLIEEAREFAQSQGLEEPPDGRAWGAIPRTLQRTLKIDHAGFRNARSSNRSPKVAWKWRPPTE